MTRFGDIELERKVKWMQDKFDEVSCIKDLSTRELLRQIDMAECNDHYGWGCCCYKCAKKGL